METPKNWEISIEKNGTHLMALDLESMLFLLQSLSKVEDFGALPKQGHNVTQKFDYTSYEQWAAFLKPRLLAQDIYMSLSEDHLTQEFIDVTRSTGNAGVDAMAQVSITVGYWSTKVGAVLFVAGAGAGRDSGDKGPNKALTAATKYLTMRGNLTSDKEADSDSEEGTEGTGGSGPRIQPEKGKQDEAPEGKQAAGGEPVGSQPMDTKTLSPEIGIVVGSARKYYDMTDAEITEAFNMPIQKYGGDRQAGFLAIDLWAKAHDRKRKSYPKKG